MRWFLAAVVFWTVWSTPALAELAPTDKVPAAGRQPLHPERQIDLLRAVRS